MNFVYFRGMYVETELTMVFWAVMVVVMIVW
jgi:hypothetical protein